MLYHSLSLLYPYPYKTFALLVSAVILFVLYLPIYGIYRLILCKLKDKGKADFKRILKIIGICLLVLFVAEMTVSMITQHHVNKQLGFNYATPETPEGEFFEIIRVDSGKVMEQSGLQLYDRVQMSSVGQLYRLLINNQGEEVAFTVLRDNELIEIRLKVPQMDVPLRKLTFLF